MERYFSDARHYIDIYNGDSIDVMDKLIEDGVQIDLTVTSPPYDKLRAYSGKDEWNFEVFKKIADRLYKITRDGGVVVWIVGDAVVNGSETGSSFKQALYFMELGFKLHDTMIYEKNSSAFPAAKGSKRYTQIFEYMFVFCKGKIRDDISLIADKENRWAGWTNWGKHHCYNVKGELVESSKIKPIPDFSIRNNIWKYQVGSNTGDDQTTHPAVFPERLAEDHILSWSVEGDIVYDPFLGSGTTGKVAILNNRKFIGSEIFEEYFKIAKDRITKYDTPIIDERFMDSDMISKSTKSEKKKELNIKLNELF